MRIKITALLPSENALTRNVYLNILLFSSFNDGGLFFFSFFIRSLLNVCEIKLQSQHSYIYVWPVDSKSRVEEFFSFIVSSRYVSQPSGVRCVTVACFQLLFHFSTDEQKTKKNTVFFVCEHFSKVIHMYIPSHLIRMWCENVWDCFVVVIQSLFACIDTHSDGVVHSNKIPIVHMTQETLIHSTIDWEKRGSCVFVVV